MGIPESPLGCYRKSPAPTSFWCTYLESSPRGICRDGRGRGRVLYNAVEGVARGRRGPTDAVIWLLIQKINHNLMRLLAENARVKLTIFRATSRYPSSLYIGSCYLTAANLGPWQLRRLTTLSVQDPMTASQEREWKTEKTGGNLHKKTPWTFLTMSEREHEYNENEMKRREKISKRRRKWKIRDGENEMKRARGGTVGLK